MSAVLSLVFVLVLLAFSVIAVAALIPADEDYPVSAPTSDPHHHREYLLARGWEVEEYLEEASLNLPFVAPWRHPEDGRTHTLSGALLAQLTEDIGSLGGYGSLMSPADVAGTNAGVDARVETGLDPEPGR